MVSASATTVKILYGNQVRYKNDKSVEQAIDQLYEKADELYGYHIGDEITLVGEKYYVITESPARQDYVVAWKAEPFTAAEVNTYGGVGTENNHVNRYASHSVGTAFNWHGYGVMAYYSSETCGIVNDSTIMTGCISSYDDSEVKYVVDAWLLDKFENNEIKEVEGYSSRLITQDEYSNIPNTYSWRYLTDNNQWTMNFGTKSKGLMIYINKQGGISENVGQYTSNGNGGVVRPVINVYKSAVTR